MVTMTLQGRLWKRVALCLAAVSAAMLLQCQDGGGQGAATIDKAKNGFCVFERNVCTPCTPARQDGQNPCPIAPGAGAQGKFVEDADCQNPKSDARKSAGCKGKPKWPF